MWRRGGCCSTRSSSFVILIAIFAYLYITVVYLLGAIQPCDDNYLIDGNDERPCGRPGGDRHPIHDHAALSMWKPNRNGTFEKSFDDAGVKQPPVLDRGDAATYDGVVVASSRTVSRSSPWQRVAWSGIVADFRQRRYQKAQERSTDIEGPGEGGVAVVLTPEEQKEADRLFPNETFNVVASNKMAMDRRIRDVRHPA